MLRGCASRAQWRHGYGVRATPRCGGRRVMDAFRSTLSTTRAEKSAQKSGAALSARVPGARAHERNEARRACLKRTGRAGRPAHRTIIAVAVRAAVWRANFRRAESISAARRAISGHAQIRMGIPRERPLPQSWRSASVRTARRRTRITPIAASANPFSTEQNILPRRGLRSPSRARPGRFEQAGELWHMACSQHARC